MTIVISTALHRWLLEKGFEGYIKVAESPPHLDALDIAKKLNVDKVTNTMVRQKLGLPGLGEKHVEIAPAKTLAKIFRRIFNILNPFFREVANFLLEEGCIHTNTYRMPKQKADIVIDTFEGCTVDWGVIMGSALR